MLMPKRFVLALLLLSAPAVADGVRLPVHSLRDQAGTRHCWAYAMSNFLESRALTRQSLDVTFMVEKDLPYWLNFERMQYIYRSKGDFYLDHDEGGWQIEYFEMFLKHGKAVQQAHLQAPKILYSFPQPFLQHLPFMPAPVKGIVPTQPEIDAFKKRLQSNEIKTGDEATRLIIAFLNKWYGGPPALSTPWANSSIPLGQVTGRVLGQDGALIRGVEDFILVKPITDGHTGWVSYLKDRYWGYRLEQDRILPLIKQSLRMGWPVTFDNVYHAMTIVGYEEDSTGSFFAIADSVPGKITWYQDKSLIPQLNLVSVMKPVVGGIIPPRGMSTIRSENGRLNFDKIDRLTIRPR